MSTQLEQVLGEHRERLKRFAALRLDRRLAPRVDASDVIQEAYQEAFLRFAEFQSQSTVNAYVWLRFLVGQKIAQIHGRHFSVAGRDPRKEVRLDGAACPPALSSLLAIALVDRVETPSGIAKKKELQSRVQQLLDEMEFSDREIIALRHFEQLDNREAAAILQISPDAAYKRYIRALKRLKDVMIAPEPQ